MGGRCGGFPAELKNTLRKIKEKAEHKTGKLVYNGSIEHGKNGEAMKYLIFYAVDMLLWSAVLVLLLALVAHISGHRPSRAQTFWKLLLALYLAAVYNVAGAPELPYIYPRLNINLIPLWDITNGAGAYLVNSGLNILLFVPLGFILPLLWKEFRSRRSMCLTGFLLSLGIELAQLLNYRISDVDDLIMNTLGAWLGYELVMLLSRRKKNLLIQEQADGRKMFLAMLSVVVLVMFALRPYITRAVSSFMF